MEDTKACKDDVKTRRWKDYTRIRIPTGKAIQSFDDLELKVGLVLGINEYGFFEPSVIQELAITPIIQGHNVIVQGQSGSGKTSTIAVAVCQLVDTSKRQVQALVVSPTRDLALQTEKVIMALGRFMKIQTHSCIGGRSVAEDIKKIEKGVHVVSATPGRILSLMKSTIWPKRSIKIVVFDESDELLSFKDQIYEVYENLPRNMQVVLVSTGRCEIREMTNKFMMDPVSIVVKPEDLNLEGLKQFYVPVMTERRKFPALCKVYEKLTICDAVIFCNNNRKVDWLTETMRKDNFSVSSMHGDMTQTEKEAIMGEFRAGKTRALITTDILAFCLNVSLVVNYDFPDRRELYLHRVGCSRSFWRKRERFAVSLVKECEGRILQDIQKYTEIDRMPAHLI